MLNFIRYLVLPAPSRDEKAAIMSAFHDLPFCLPRGGDMARGLAETPQAIGMTTMTVVDQSGGRVRGRALNGVPATPTNVRVVATH